MAIKFTNNASTKLYSAITATDIVVNVSPGTGAKFPVTAVGDYFMITVVDAQGNLEIMRVTSRVGDKLNVVRAQEGTTAKVFAGNSGVEHRFTAGTMDGVMAVAASSAAAVDNRVTAVDNRVTAVDNAISPIVKNKNWQWSGQGGQPSYVWGSNDGNTFQVWTPSNFNVAKAEYATTAGLAYTAYTATIAEQLRGPGVQITSERELSLFLNAQQVIAYSISNLGIYPMRPRFSALGSSTYVWSTIHLDNAPFVSSDARGKTLENSTGAIDPAILRAWKNVNPVQYKRNTSIINNGVDKARIHTGYIAQEIEAAFKREGLEPLKYAQLNHAIIEEKPAVLNDLGDIIEPKELATDSYSLCYDECLCIEVAYQRDRADKLEARILALESKVA